MDKITNTFWKLLQAHQVEIPVIQRDYAQGRVNDRVQQIRKNFVKALVDNLADGKVLPLDFIYGKIEGKGQEEIIRRNENAVDSMLKAVQSYASELSITIEYEMKTGISSDGTPFTKLIPLDGQQRLTTLYLLHWYLVQRLSENREYKHQLQILSRFGYQTRKTTKAFCNALTTPYKDNASFYDFEKATLSEQLKSATWFLKIWLNDPSVKGMLVMLDELHSQLKDVKDIQPLWDNLIKHDCIRFDFLDLDKLNQTDDLYVKMNARGKALTDFEHFKAWLQEYVSKQEIHLTEIQWKHKIDTKWYDLFWKNKPKGSYIIDDTIYDFIKNVGLYEYIVSPPKEVLNRTFIDRIRNENNKKEDYIGVNDFQESHFIYKENLDFVFNSLNSLIGIDFTKYTTWLEEIYTTTFNKTTALTNFYLSVQQTSLSLHQRVFYYGFLLFINEYSELEEENKARHFKAWMRITRNLIFNTNIQSLDDFINALRALKKLSNQILNIEEYLEKEFQNIDFFNKEQRKEESLKIQYFTLDNFKEAILRLENHSYFYGQIGFLFRLLPDDKKRDFDLFKKYGDRLYQYFGEIASLKDFKLQRTLLKYGDYFIPLRGGKYSFCKSEAGALRTRNDNWRKVFNASDESEQFKALSRFVKQEHLEDIQDWRKYFIEYAEIMKYSTSTFIDWYNPLDIRLMNKSNYNGRHSDLYVFIISLYLNANKVGLEDYTFIPKDVKYYRTTTRFPYLEILYKNKKVLVLSYHPQSENTALYRIERVSSMTFSLLEKFVTEHSNRFEITINNLSGIDNFIENTLPKILKHPTP